jgi:hypothetical protein
MELVINTLPSYTSILKAAFGNVKHLNYKLYYQQLLLKYLVTWKGIDYKLPEDDTIVSKHVGV